MELSVQSTPKKKSRSHSVPITSNVVEHSPEVVVQLSECRAELSALLLLATSFDLADLKKA